MKRIFRTFLPGSLYRLGKKCYYSLLHARFRLFGRPARSGETGKARARRQREGFFDKFCQGKGLDIGYGGDLLTPNCTGWDFEHGDAQYLRGIPDASYDFVYASHTLEHLVKPDVALRNWWRVVKPGGFLIVAVPDRDLYEKKRTLPSLWNLDHKHFFLLENDEEPDTIGVIPLIRQTLPNSELIYAKVCGAGHTITDPMVHSDGEFSIEAVVRKLAI